MPNDLAVSTTALSASALRADPVTPIEAAQSTDASTTASAAAVSSSASSTLFANPSLQLNADLGIVVIQLRDAGGSVNQIPSQRQLDAYISGSAHLPGSHPAASDKQTVPVPVATAHPAPIKVSTAPAPAATSTPSATASASAVPASAVAASSVKA